MHCAKLLRVKLLRRLLRKVLLRRMVVLHNMMQRNGSELRMVVVVLRRHGQRTVGLLEQLLLAQGRQGRNNALGSLQKFAIF